MATSRGPRRLSRARADLSHAVESFLRRTGFPVPTGGEGTDSASGKLGTDGGAISRDGERRKRALAKEIKRLITEDTRRGIGI